MWLADALFDTVGRDLGGVLVLGGWFGVLPAILLHDPRFAIASVVSLDIDPRCADLARALNATHGRAGRFAAVTADMLDYDYLGFGGAAAGVPDLVSIRAASTCRNSLAGLNAFPTDSSWCCSRTIIRVKRAYRCVPDLAAFRPAPLSGLLFAASASCGVTRFMLIGRK